MPIQSSIWSTYSTTGLYCMQSHNLKQSGEQACVPSETAWSGLLIADFLDT